MTAEETPTDKTKKKKDDATPEPAETTGPRAFIKILGESGKWAIGALAAAGSFAVAQFGLSKIGKSTVNATPPTFALDWPLGGGWAFVGAVVFTLGVVWMVLNIVQFFRATRVSMAYLVDDPLGKQITTDIQQHMSYLLVGCANLEALIGEYASLSGGDETPRVQQLEAARFAILETATAERIQREAPDVMRNVAVGALVAVVGAVIFSYHANAGEVFREDQVRQLAQAREDELREFPSGELLPRTPSSVVLMIPVDADQDDPWRTKLTDACLYQTVDEPAPGTLRPRQIPSTLVDVGESGSTPGPVSNEELSIFRIVTSETEKCPDVVDGWVPPDWVASPISAEETDDPSEPSAGSTSTPSPSPS